MWLGYPSSHGSTGSIESTSSPRSCLSILNTDNTRSVTPSPSSSSSSSKILPISKLLIRGVAFPDLIWWPVFLMPPTRSTASSRRLALVLTIFSLGEIMPSCSRCSEKGLLYVAIASPSGRQPSSCAECTKANMRSSCNVRSVSDAKCARRLRL